MVVEGWGANQGKPQKIAIIGAGVSGILCGSVLKKDGHIVTLFEKSSTVGGVYAHAYPGAALQNTWRQYHHPDLPYPSSQPGDFHPTAPQLHQYFQDCARYFDLDVKLNTCVIAMNEKEDDIGWGVVYETKDEDDEPIQRETTFDFVVIAQGHYSRSDIKIPFQGAERFQQAGGTVLMTKEINDLSILKGKRVVIVGYGKTAVDMCTFAVNHGATSTTHVFRNARCLIPKNIAGIDIQWFLFNRCNNELIPSWDHATAVLRFLHALLPSLFYTIWWVIQQVAWFFQTRSCWFVSHEIH